jgi:hypothetical protein
MKHHRIATIIQNCGLIETSQTEAATAAAATAAAAAARLRTVYHCEPLRAIQWRIVNPVTVILKAAKKQQQQQQQQRQKMLRSQLPFGHGILKMRLMKNGERRHLDTY